VRPTAGEQKLAVRLLRTTRLDDGEVEVLALASRRKLLLVVDDKEAHHVAEALGIAYIGTAGVLLEAYLRRRLTLAGLEDVPTDLTKVLWLSPSVVAAVLKKAREAKQ
jgi:predicted nucleic acid-binding protein